MSFAPKSGPFTHLNVVRRAEGNLAQSKPDTDFGY
jgi:hypothetical protein